MPLKEYSQQKTTFAKRGFCFLKNEIDDKIKSSNFPLGRDFRSAPTSASETKDSVQRCPT